MYYLLQKCLFYSKIYSKMLKKKICLSYKKKTNTENGQEFILNDRLYNFIFCKHTQKARQNLSGCFKQNMLWSNMGKVSLFAFVCCSKEIQNTPIKEISTKVLPYRLCCFRSLHNQIWFANHFTTGSFRIYFEPIFNLLVFSVNVSFECLEFHLFFASITYKQVIIIKFMNLNF